MARKKKNQPQTKISEEQIEDAFVANLTLLQETIKCGQEIRLIARQLRLSGGSKKLDLLVSSGKELFLIELKAIEFCDEFLPQIIGYREELLALQEKGELISGKINSYLLVTGASAKQQEIASKNGVKIVIFKPLEVLTNYYKRIASSTNFFGIKPNDYGVMNLGKLNSLLLELSKGVNDKQELSKKIKLALVSISHHLKLSSELGLIYKRNEQYFLTELGNLYAAGIESGTLTDNLSASQIEILKKHIAGNPFYSPPVFGIYAIVESAFLLARNIYPIELKDLKNVFRIVGGKMTEWQSRRSLNTAAYTFLKFAVDLELLGKFGKQIVITPSGFKFILMLQLHKSIFMIDGLSIK